MAEDVTAFVQRVGLQTALEIIGEDVWKYTKLSCEQWDSVYKIGVNPDDRVIKAKVLVKMIETASVTRDWLRIWEKKADNNDLRVLVVDKIKERLGMLSVFNEVVAWPRAAHLNFLGEHKDLNGVWLQRLMELATTCEDWKYVLYEGERADNADLVAKALTNMVKCAEMSGTEEDWTNVYHKAPDGSDAQKKVLGYFFRQAELIKTFNGWYDVWYRAKDKDNDLAKRAWQKAVGMASNFKEWRSIFWKKEENDLATQELCISRVRNLARTFEDWLSIYQTQDIDEGLKAEALEKMLIQEKNVDRWLSIWRWTPEGSSVKAEAAQWLKDFVIMD